MEATIYALRALTTLLCAMLLLSRYVRVSQRLLLLSGLCFCGLALANVLVFVDLVPRAHSGSLPVAARDGNNWNGVPAVRPYLGEAVKSMIQAFLLGVLATMFVTAGLCF